MRVLCLYFPQWPAQRARVAASVDDDRPVVVHAQLKNCARVVARTGSAARRGVSLGMPLAEADSLLHGTESLFVPHDAEGDRAELERLAMACAPFGPTVGLEDAEEPEAILIDVTGCGPFFGGEEPLARQAISLLSEEGYVARAGLADSIGIAWAASRTAGKSRATLVPAGRGEAWLARQPIALLRLESDLVLLLDSLGIRFVGDLMRLPRVELPSRFGLKLLQRLDQALGHLSEAIEPLRPATPLSVGWSHETPITDRQAIQTVLDWLLDRLVARLAPWEGITTLECWFGGESETTVRPASPSRSSERLGVLLDFALDRDPPPPEVQRIVLTAETTRLPAPEKTSLFATERSSAEAESAFRRLTERLCGRLGADAVLRPASTGDPLPERAVRLLPALDLATGRREPAGALLKKSGTNGDRHRKSSQPSPANGTVAGAHPTALTTHSEDVFVAATRPVLLLSHPERVTVWSLLPDGPPFRLTRNGQALTLTRTCGPERLEAGWASGLEARRDYWRVETETNERYWLFRCRRSGNWFLHGFFA